MNANNVDSRFSKFTEFYNSSGNSRWLTVSGKEIYFFNVLEKESFTSVVFDLNGKMISNENMPAVWLNSDKCLHERQFLICNSDADMYYIDYSGANKPKFEKLELDPTLPALAPDNKLLSLNAHNSLFSVIDGKSRHHIFAVRQSDSLIVVRLDAGGRLSPVVSVPQGIAATYVETSGQQLICVVGESIAMKQLEFLWFDVESGKERNDLKFRLPVTSEMVAFENIVFHAVMKKSGDTSIRGLGIGQDAALSLIQDGRILWIRQEALASVLAVEILDLPLSEQQVNIEKEFEVADDLASPLSRLIARLNSQICQMRIWISNFMREIMKLLEILASSIQKGSIQQILMSFSNNGQLHNKVKPTELVRDYFNLNKVIVAVSHVGKIFGLESSTGRILWQLWLNRRLTPFQNANAFKIPLFVLRTAAHPPNSALCAIIMKETAGNVLISFNPISGTLEDVTRFPSVLQTISSPVADGTGLHALFVLDNELQVYLFPKDVKIDFNSLPPLYLFTADSTSGIVNGYQIRAGPSVSLVWQTSLKVEELQKITQVQIRKLDEQIHSPGRVLGDRSVLYKYMNPNLASVVLETADAEGKPSVTVHLFDAVTGSIEFSAVHKRAQGPVLMVHCENWIVYSTWNVRWRRRELAVLELYEGRQQWHSSRIDSLRPSPFPPTVMRQAYVFPQGMTALGVTNTERGMTSRHLIVAMPFGGILQLPKMFLDPRRAIYQTPEHREEGLIPYIPELPVATEHIINYNQTVEGIRAIYSSPTGLESTSLVLAYGLDMFFTRVTPSGTFDVLKDDFDHIFISIVLIGLLLASVVCKKLAKIKDLKQAWK